MDSAPANASHRIDGYDFQAARAAWSRPPVDDVGYVDAARLLQWNDDTLRNLVANMERQRYDTNDWRNWQNQWREFFGLDRTTDKHILDFGCGVGIEALQFARKGNRVSIADITEDNVRLARRVLNMHGYEPSQMIDVEGTAPFFTWVEPFDVFYASGVLHHTPHMRAILRRACDCAKEIRLLVYSDRRWTNMGVPLPPIDQEIITHSTFQRFVRSCDEVGQYADWYSPEKLTYRIEGIAQIERWAYIGRGEEFLGAILRP